MKLWRSGWLVKTKKLRDFFCKIITQNLIINKKLKIILLINRLTDVDNQHKNESNTRGIILIDEELNTLDINM